MEGLPEAELTQNHILKHSHVKPAELNYFMAVCIFNSQMFNEIIFHILEKGDPGPLFCNLNNMSYLKQIGSLHKHNSELIDSVDLVMVPGLRL